MLIIFKMIERIKIYTFFFIECNGISQVHHPLQELQNYFLIDSVFFPDNEYAIFYVEIIH